MKQGYSLWEALCVLCIISLLLVIVPQPHLNHWNEEYQFRLFCDRLSHQLLMSQSKAIMEQTPVRVRFSHDLNEVKFTSTTDLQHSTILPVPEQWQIASYFQFYYLPNGHTNQFKAIRFIRKSTGKPYKVKFQLGSGRFEVEH